VMQGTKVTEILHQLSEVDERDNYRLVSCRQDSDQGRQLRRARDVDSVYIRKQKGSSQRDTTLLSSAKSDKKCIA
jgi:hypothetical protein